MKKDFNENLTKFHQTLHQNEMAAISFECLNFRLLFLFSCVDGATGVLLCFLSGRQITRNVFILTIFSLQFSAGFSQVPVYNPQNWFRNSRDTRIESFKMIIKYTLLSLLLATVFLQAFAASKSALVLLDHSSVKKTHSIFFKSLRGK